MKKCSEIGCNNEAEGMSPICSDCVNKACEKLANILQQGVGGFSPVAPPPPSQLDRIEAKLDRLFAPQCTCQIQQFCAVHNPMRGISA